MLKKWRKKLAKHTFSRFQCIIQITFFLHYLGCTISDCVISLFGKILELEIFELKVATCVGWTRSGPEPHTNCMNRYLDRYKCKFGNVQACTPFKNSVLGVCHIFHLEERAMLLKHNTYSSLHISCKNSVGGIGSLCDASFS